PNTISVDPDAGVISRLRDAGIDARTGSIGALPLASASVEAVVASEVIEHLSPELMQAGFDQIRRVLKPGGIFLGTVPFNEDLAAATVYCPTCRQSFHRWGHRQSFSVESLKTQLSTHFSVLTVRPVYFAPWHLLNWKGKVAASGILALSLLG